MAARTEIGPFLRRHLDRVLAIETACFAREAYPRELFCELYRECGSFFFVARRARRIVGYAVTSTAGAQAEVVSIAVVPKHRDAGVGTALMRHTIARLRRARVRTLALMVRPGNRKALRLYRRLGFRSAGRIARYYEDGADGLLMRKRL
jgi:[ribosomal protein S18]-alanine N-acetyltransferase